MTYEYVCTACSHHWEAEQSISAAPLKTCPSCHADAAKRQISGGAGFILKGGGWYADLYGSAKPAAKVEGSASEAKKTESASTTTAPSKDASSSSGSGTSTTTPTKPSPAAAS